MLLAALLPAEVIAHERDVLAVGRGLDPLEVRRVLHVLGQTLAYVEVVLEVHLAHLAPGVDLGRPYDVLGQPNPTLGDSKVHASLTFSLKRRWYSGSSS